ncbi:MAG: helix-turn-helix domain-containing protein [Nocardioidaceae bacterium]|nr:helix-turn-helix domain-containing protein [Nocardioidaceae bacterium]MCL2613689.1 helix-turn-helix domain-containing protein [Nocardioidaceae bacterium]
MRKVAVVVQDGVEPFGLGSMCEVWAEPYHPEDGNPVFDFVIATPRPGRVRGPSGFDLYVENALEVALEADLVCVAPKRDFTEPSPEVSELLREVDRRGTRIFAHCSGAFQVGEAGLLDGRRCTTHWRFIDRLGECFPEAKVEGDVLYVQDGNLTTGAGSSAGLDASLHIMREEFGAAVAAATARRMVVPPHRDGGQAQFIARAVPDCQADTLGPLLIWITENLPEDHSVEALARRAHMSPRTFARRFRDETGSTPHSWVTRQRVAAAEELLERSDASVDRIAAEVGFGNAATLRHHFTRVRGIGPQAYRRQFAC